MIARNSPTTYGSVARAFHWGMALHMPWSSLAGLAFVLLVLAMATTVASARQAMGPDVVRAVKEDW